MSQAGDLIRSPNEILDSWTYEQVEDAHVVLDFMQELLATKPPA